MTEPIDVAVAHATQQGWRLQSVHYPTGEALMASTPGSLLGFHLVNGVVTLLTFGFWLPVWVLLSFVAYAIRVNERRVILLRADGTYDVIGKG